VAWRSYLINPWLEIQDMKEKVDRFMDAARPGTSRDVRGEATALWKPAADVYETPHTYMIQVELAGLDRESIHLEVKERVLHLYGERRVEKEAGQGGYLVLERSYGPFARSFSLPKDADPATISAVHHGGVLTITMQKELPESFSRRIQISED
jgi:HSP20 family protein